jgi:hypothetical protein
MKSGSKVRSIFAVAHLAMALKKWVSICWANKHFNSTCQPARKINQCQFLMSILMIDTNQESCYLLTPDSEASNTQRDIEPSQASLIVVVLFNPAVEEAFCADSDYTRGCNSGARIP